MLAFKSGVRTDYEILSDKIVAAMETGNPQAARLVVAEHKEAFPNEIDRIRTEVLKDYGIRI
jgi:hypothetical protein